MVAYVFSYVDRQILSMLVGPIRTDLGLSDTEVSLLHGLAFAICYTVLGVWPIGRWPTPAIDATLSPAVYFFGR